MQKLFRLSFGPLALAGIVIAIGVPCAQADIDGTLNFTVSSGGPAPTGSFVYDTTTNTLTSYTADWDGVVYDFSGFAFGTIPNSGNWCAAALNAGPSVCPSPLFGLASVTVGPVSPIFTDSSAAANGTYTVTEPKVSPVPEPNSFVLLLSAIGLGALLLMRKPFARRSPAN